MHTFIHVASNTLFPTFSTTHVAFITPFFTFSSFITHISTSIYAASHKLFSIFPNSYVASNPLFFIFSLPLHVASPTSLFSFFSTRTTPSTFSVASTTPLSFFLKKAR
jgi:hypothetical protein